MTSQIMIMTSMTLKLKGISRMTETTQTGIKRRSLRKKRKVNMNTKMKKRSRKNLSHRKLTPLEKGGAPYKLTTLLWISISLTVMSISRITLE